MGIHRAWVSAVGLTVAISTLVVRGQSADERHVILSNLGLAAIDEGVLVNEPHGTGTVEALHRAATRVALRDSGGTAAARYARGRVIVKFRDQTTAAERLSAVAEVSPSARIDARPSYADFDIVRIDSDQDVEATAAALRERGEAEYAQPAYNGWHTMFVPNDPQYALRQWNLRLVNLERAWDIQPQAGSSITVAVLDTGLAYMNATLIENIPAFRDENGVRYPA